MEGIRIKEKRKRKKEQGKKETETEKEEKKIRGKKGRAAGKRFELLVRKDLEEQSWIVAKWTNQVDIKKDKLIPAKSKFNPFLGRTVSEGTGFPDFLCLKKQEEGWSVIGVESKLGKYLDAQEKKKAEWLLNKNIFDSILIAYKPGRGKIEYENFLKKKVYPGIAMR